MKKSRHIGILLSVIALALFAPMNSFSSVQSDEIPIAEHYEGGTAKLNADLAANLQYPPAAKRNRIQGTQKVAVTLMPDGSVTNFRCLNSLGAGCCEEAQRVIKTLKFKAPGYQANYTIPVRFKL